ncbi:MAG: cytochrome c maturation protein CcmE [Gammaproteobacteria bacterium]|nr:cytochrome c maturation protein CcmE [Gammaproteobacteria bacterium]
MTPRHRRMVGVAAILAGVGAAALLARLAFEENLLYFFSPSQIAAGEAPVERKFRVGGLVTPGSVQRDPGSLTVRFVVTDNRHSIPVRYSGVLPDLFKEGKGVVANGRLDGQGGFVAEEVLAKHDENYMPPEVADSMHPPQPGGGGG